MSLFYELLFLSLSHGCFYVQDFTLSVKFRSRHWAIGLVRLFDDYPPPLSSI
mgnify:CR=1 FL=1